MEPKMTLKMDPKRTRNPTKGGQGPPLKPFGLKSQMGESRAYLLVMGLPLQSRPVGLG